MIAHKAVLDRVAPWRASIACLLLLLAFCARVEAQQPLTVGTVTAAPGTTASGTLEIAARAGDQGTTLPVTVINGAKPGPVLALTAGVHGQEYTPVLAVQRLRTSIDPKTLAGAVIMVHVANMPSFLARTIYYSPADGKNLNRVFPGAPMGPYPSGSPTSSLVKSSSAPRTSWTSTAVTAMNRCGPMVLDHDGRP